MIIEIDKLTDDSVSTQESFQRMAWVENSSSKRPSKVAGVFLSKDFPQRLHGVNHKEELDHCLETFDFTKCLDCPLLSMDTHGSVDSNYCANCAASFVKQRDGA